MSDAEIRRLERALAADPSDAYTVQALARALTRTGRGWTWEALPTDLVCSTQDHGVYIWERHGLGLEMVRVPAKIAPAFYIGRYPVTDIEWELYYHSRFKPSRNLRALPGHPVVNVSYNDAVSFCNWNGLRIPTTYEWTRAAFGDGSACASGLNHHDGPRPYPWGNAEPTPERCVSAWWNQTPPGPTRSTVPVHVNGKPARPDGVSPCGAQDMYGHVFEFTSDTPNFEHISGSSFRRNELSVYDDTTSSDDIGFRVAL